MNSNLFDQELLHPKDETDISRLTLDQKKQLDASASPSQTNPIATMQDVNNPKVYVALLTQASTQAPTAAVLKNTIGTIVWTRGTTGTYVGTLTGAFTVDKTIPGVASVVEELGSGNFVQIVQTSANVITIYTGTAATLVGGVLSILADGLLTKYPISISVYQ